MSNFKIKFTGCQSSKNEKITKNIFLAFIVFMFYGNRSKLLFAIQVDSSSSQIKKDQIKSNSLCIRYVKVIRFWI